MNPASDTEPTGCIIDVVAKLYETTPAALTSRSRRKEVMVPRQIAMYLCRRYTSQPVSAIARAFARSHPSVSNAEQVVERRMLASAPFRYRVEAISARLDELIEKIDPMEAAMNPALSQSDRETQDAEDSNTINAVDEARQALLLAQAACVNSGDHYKFLAQNASRISDHVGANRLYLLAALEFDAADLTLSAKLSRDKIREQAS